MVDQVRNLSISSVQHYILFSSLDSCDTEKEEEVVEYISNNDLITLGWIHVLHFISLLSF